MHQISNAFVPDNFYFEQNTDCASGYYVNQGSRGAKNPVDLCDKCIECEDENAIVGDGFQ